MTDTRPDAEELRDVCRRFLDDRAPLGLLDADADARRPLWDEITAMGWPATLLPEEVGGLGWGWAEAATVACELGRSLAPVPFLTTALLAASGLRTGPSAAASDAMTAIASGSAQVAVVGLPRPRTHGDAVILVPGPDGDRLRGTAPFVLDGAGADHLLVVAEREGSPVVALTEGPDGLDVSPLDLTDRSRSAAAIGFADAPAVVIADGDGAEAAIAAMESALLVGLACDALGGARWVLDETVEYARTRVQFDRPIGSFQAIKHRLADLYVLLQGTAAIVDAAVTELAAAAPGPPTTIANLAHAYAADAYARIAGDAILVHGAIGFTWEHPLHRYLKRALLNRQLAGSTDSHRDRHLDARLATLARAS